MFWNDLKKRVDNQDMRIKHLERDVTALRNRVATLEKDSHKPYDFTHMEARLKKLESTKKISRTK